MHVGSRAEAREWRGAVHADGADAWNFRDSGKKVLEESDAGRVIFVFGVRQRDLEGQQVGRIKAWINSNEPGETANQKAGTCQQNEREAHLHDHEGASCVTA